MSSQTLFHGKKEEDINILLELLKINLSVNYIENEKWVQVAASYLRGTAFKTYIQLKSQQKMETWSDFEENMLTIYKPNNF